MKSTSLVVVGTPYSGAALLGHMLGAHSQVFFAGELWRHWDRTAEPGERDCRGCGATCETWGDPQVQRAIAGGPAALSAALATASGRRVVVEGPASSAWLDVRIADGVPEGEDARIVLCVCDPVLYARKRAGVTEPLARRRAVEWRDEQQALVRTALSSGRPVLVVHYENLVDAPAETFARVLSFAGLAPRALRATWWQAATHAIGARSEKWGMAVVRDGESPPARADARTLRVDTLAELDADPAAALGAEAVRAVIDEVRPAGLYETFGYEPALPAFTPPRTDEERAATAVWVREELRRTRDSVFADRAGEAIVTLRMLAEHFGPAFDDLGLDLDYENLAIVLVDLLNGQHRYAEALPHALRLLEARPQSVAARRLLAVARSGAGLEPVAESGELAASRLLEPVAEPPLAPREDVRAGELAPTV